MHLFRHIHFLTLAMALALTACAPAAIPTEKTPASPASQAGLPLAPVKPESTATTAETPLPNRTVTYAESLPIAIWDLKTRQHQLQLVDPLSGQPVDGYMPISLGVNYYYTYSPDRKMLALVTYHSDSYPTGPALHLLDLSNWHDKTFELQTSGWVSSLAFSSDGSLLAIAQNFRDSNLSVFDVESQTLIAQDQIDFMASHLKFSADGQTLMLYGPVLVDRFTENERSDGPPMVALLKTADLQVEWSVRIEGLNDGIYATAEQTQNLHQPGAAVYYSPGVAFSPVQDRLYIVHPDTDELTTVDFTNRSINTVGIRPQLSWLERFLRLTAGVAYAKAVEGSTRSAIISPDGQTLFIVGNRTKFNQLANGDLKLTQTPLDFQIIATSDGGELASFKSNASDLAISPDDQIVLVRYWGNDGDPRTDIFDIQGGKFVDHLDHAYLIPARRMDGTILLVSAIPDEKNNTHLSVYSSDGWNLLGSWEISNYGNWLILQ